MNYKTEGDFMYDPKQRIKTEIQPYSKKVERDISYGYAFGKNSYELKIASKDNSLQLKTGLEEDRVIKNAENYNQFSGNQRGYMTFNKINSQGSKVDAILSSAITFRECVNILHYCRLIFKHLLSMKEIGFGD